MIASDQTIARRIVALRVLSAATAIGVYVAAMATMIIE